MFSSRRGSSSSNPKAVANKSKAKKPKAKKLTYAELEARAEAAEAEKAELAAQNAKLAEEKEELTTEKAKSDAKVAELTTEKAKLTTEKAKLTTEKAELVTKEVERSRKRPVTEFLGKLTGPYLGNPSMKEGSKDEKLYFAPSRVSPAPFSMMFVDRDKEDQLKLRRIQRSYAKIIDAKLFGNSDTNGVKYDGVGSEADIAQRATAVTKACNEEVLIPDVVSRGQILATFLEQRAGTTQGTKCSSNKRDSKGVAKPTAGLRPDVLQVQFPGMDFDPGTAFDPVMDVDPVYRMVGEYKFILPLDDKVERNAKNQIVRRTPVDVALMYNDKKNGVGVRCAVNQIYTYMVVLELRYAYLCTYNTWWFLKRTRDTTVKKSKKNGTTYEETGEETLYISEPICVDSVGSSAKKKSAAATAAPAGETFSLCEAYCYFALTAINDDSAVGYTAAREILARVVKTYHKFPNNVKLKEDKKKLQGAVRDFMHQRFAATAAASTPGTTTAADLQAIVVLIDKLPLVELPREPEYIEEVARGRAGTVFKGRVEDVPFEVMIKITDLIRTPELRDEMELEYQCYCRMVPLWGTVVPFCIWAGSMPNFRVGLVTSIAGEMGLGAWVLQGKHNVKYDTLANNLTHGLAQIHARGVAHGDVTARNIMIDDDGSGKVMFVDFGCSTLLNSDGSNVAEFEAAKQDDLERLKDVLGWVKYYLIEDDEELASSSCARKRMSLRIA